MKRSCAYEPSPTEQAGQPNLFREQKGGKACVKCAYKNLNFARNAIIIQQFTIEFSVPTPCLPQKGCTTLPHGAKSVSHLCNCATQAGTHSNHLHAKRLPHRRCRSDWPLCYFRQPCVPVLSPRATSRTRGTSARSDFKLRITFFPVFLCDQRGSKHPLHQSSGEAVGPTAGGYYSPWTR